MLSSTDNCSSDLVGKYQQVVFIKKEDVEIYDIETKLEKVYEALEPIPYHRIKFKLKSGKKGLRFSLSELSTVIEADFSKSNSDGIPKYEHNVTIGVYGVSERKKWILKQFDLSDEYFAALLNKNGVVEIFGFHNGFETSNYTYNNDVSLSLKSTFEELEIPYVYISEIEGEEGIDFDNDFSIKKDKYADFNKDFNKDFNTK